MLLLLFVFGFITTVGFAAPPDLLVDPQLQVDDAFYRYFQAGATYKNIQSLLLIHHGIALSLSALKMKRLRMGITPRKGQTRNTYDEIRLAISHLLPSLPWTAGYRNVYQTLKHMGYDVRRKTVQTFMQELDPDGVDQRKRRRLRRRRYISPGPNYIWHVDGYDKLKPYGFAIHGAIDGFSRRIMWLEVNPSNNNPRFVASYYMECVRQNKGCPHIVSTDPGTENGTIAALQCTFREDDDDDYSGINSHQYVKSTSNQRIESWWCIFRRDRMEWWINFFTNLAASPEFNKDYNLHRLCIRYVFMPLLQGELREIATRWNNHYNTGNPMGKCPTGRPNLLYSLHDSFLHHVSDVAIEEAFQECENQTRSGDTDFDEYAQIIFDEMHWIDADTPEIAYEQYIYLRNTAEAD